MLLGADLLRLCLQTLKQTQRLLLHLYYAGQHLALAVKVYSNCQGWETQLITYIDYQETQATQHSTVDIIIQWNLSVEDTTGTQLVVLYREVSLSQRYICTQLYAVWTADSALI